MRRPWLWLCLPLVLAVPVLAGHAPAMLGWWGDFRAMQIVTGAGVVILTLVLARARRRR